MGFAKRLSKNWVWPFGRLIFLQIFAHGFILWLGWLGYHPEVWVARMLSAADMVLGVEAARWMLGGVLGLVVQIGLEAYLNGGIGLGRIFNRAVSIPSASAERKWYLPSPWEVSVKACRDSFAGITRAIKNGIALLYYLIPGLNYEVTMPVPSSLSGDLSQMRDSQTFFWIRFGNAFPGIREPREFTNTSDIAHRMGILLRDPLASGGSETPHHPLWWARGTQDFYLQRWFRLKRNIFLLNEKELRVSRIVAVPGRSYWQCFVYVECEPMRSSGLNDDYYTSERIAREVKDFAYASEHFTIYKFRTYQVSEAEDGSFERRGRVQRFKHPPEMRVRYLTRYNFLVVPNAAPVMAHELQDRLRQLLDDCLSGSGSTEQLITWALRLPRNREAESHEEGF